MFDIVDGACDSSDIFAALKAGGVFSLQGRVGLARDCRRRETKLHFTRALPSDGPLPLLIAAKERSLVVLFDLLETRAAYNAM